MRTIWFQTQNSKHEPELKKINPLIVLETANSLEEVFFLLKNGQFDCIVTYLKDCYTNNIITLRSKLGRVPMIVLDSGLTKSRISIIEAGADYLIELFNESHTMELASAITAMSRRFRGLPSSIVQIDDLCIDLECGSFSRKGESIILRPREAEIFCYLLFRRGKIVYNRELEESFNCSINNISAHLCTITAKLKLPKGHPARFVRHWGRGIMLA